MIDGIKVVILAGGRGSRLAEETETTPKPMVEIGGKPIIWHIMRYYAQFGFNEFCVALGYKGDMLKRYFADYAALGGDITARIKDGTVTTAERPEEDWVVQLTDTGQSTGTGGRVKRLEKHLCSRTFMLTYGDGVANVDLRGLLAFHRSHGRLATVTAVRPPSRFGGLVFDGDMVSEFTEKPQIGEGWINGGFFVFEPGIFKYIRGESDSLERQVLEPLAAAGELMAYRHGDFWQCMDTLRDRRLLERLWEEGAPWRVWDKKIMTGRKSGVHKRAGKAEAFMSGGRARI